MTSSNRTARLLMATVGGVVGVIVGPFLSVLITLGAVAHFFDLSTQPAAAFITISASFAAGPILGCCIGWRLGRSGRSLRFPLHTLAGAAAGAVLGVLAARDYLCGPDGRLPGPIPYLVAIWLISAALFAGAVLSTLVAEIMLGKNRISKTGSGEPQVEQRKLADD